MHALEHGFETQGHALLEALIPAQECHALGLMLDTLERSGAGSRDLLEQPWCAALACRLQQHPAVAALLPASHRAVQCTFFEKSAARNWLVALHQDLSIPVAERARQGPAARLAGWSRKQGMDYVQAPLPLLQELLALRLHLDPCGPGDGALKLVPGSHRLGILSPEQGMAVRTQEKELLCLAEPGSALLMRPLLLHASSKATGHGRRRVLHFLFGPQSPGHGLRWRD